MARRPRMAPAGFVYHVLNRAAGRLILFETSADYSSFERLLAAGQRRIGMRIIAYCLMRNHWHLLLWPERDGEVTAYMHWVTTVHARRWAIAHDAVGRGAVYQSRFKAIPIQSDDHLLTAWRYIERNPLRASLVTRAEQWTWSSLTWSPHGSGLPQLSPAPLARPRDWIEHVNAPQSDAEVNALRHAVDKGVPYGDPDWWQHAAPMAEWRPHGRPKRGRTPFSNEASEKGVRPLF
jgi:putative transposase